MTTRKPEWLKKKIEFDESRKTGTLLDSLSLNTVCKEAKCPNISECFKNKHATFLILGKNCTRSCSFCNVEKSTPLAPDKDEPKRIASAVLKMGLKHVIITSVTRDDLSDGGASSFINTIKEIRKLSKKIRIELLIPDFQSDPQIIESLTINPADIIGHNLETVPRLYSLRLEADYGKSLSVLKYIKKKDKNIRTKSSLMLGLGEKEVEVLDALKDLRTVDCDFLALGQYLRPSEKNVEVKEYITPEKFDFYKSKAISLGFKHVESAPFVRSSYLASQYL